MAISQKVLSVPEQQRPPGSGTMSDFQFTIDSDEEAPVSQHQGAQNGKQAKKDSKKRKREELPMETQNNSKRGGGSEDFVGGFTFDNLGGGFAYSAGAPGGDVWDVSDTIDLFKKKNAPPRVTVDDIIARRKAQEQQSGSESDEEVSDNAEAQAQLDSDDESDFGQEDDAASNADMPGGSEQASDDENGDEDKQQTADRSDPDDSDEAEEQDEATAAAQAQYFDQAEQPIVKKDKKLPPFSSLPNARISRPILLALGAMGLTTPTPIQAATIPVVLMGKDVVGSSVTGSGKTVAFWVGVLERLLYRDKREAKTRVVAICPTRELAVQVCNVGKALARYTDITFCLCVGGLSLKVQEAELKKRPDILVCTPGRLIDHTRNTNSFSLDDLEVLIIDEADRILEEGFRDELTEIIQSCPHNRSSLLFSATITEDVSELARISLNKPVRIKIDDLAASSATLTQEFLRVRAGSKQDLVAREATLVAVCRRTFQARCIIFFRSKQTAHRMKVVFGLCGLRADELHGDLTQEQRLTALQRFKEGQVDYLLATDLASRGLDIKGVEVVLNFEMPNSVEIYLHRVGRTARAGRDGRALTLVGESDRKMVKQAIKKAPSDSIKQRKLEPEIVSQTVEELNGLKEEVEAVLAEEKEERELRRTEMELTKQENIINHQSEIMSKPARTWFQSEGDKQKAKVASKEAALKPAPPQQKQRPEKLNHWQRKRKEALAEAKTDKSKGLRTDAAVRGAKKAARPGKLTQFADPNAPKPSSSQPKKGKKKSSGGSSFKSDLNSSSKKSGGGGGPSSKSGGAGKKVQSSTQKKGKGGGKVKGKR